MRISEEIIEKIKNENDIVDVISESVKLKRSGRNYMGICPFHHEKSPSFSVSQDKQIYKCFGCGEAGNVLTFVMKQKNLNFIEACKILAEKANIPLNTGKNEDDKLLKKKEVLYKVNIEAARYFFSNLQNEREKKEYFIRRGISELTIKRFGLGYAKEGWQNLRTYLNKKGFSDTILLEAGLVLKSEKNGTIYDRFRNRVMFPVFDFKGRVIGFGGRVLDDSKPKYLNSPETLIFQKGTNLYGLNFAIKNNIKERYFIMVEGYMDLISLNQYGIHNVVASLGTALTVKQARLLKRYADKVIISFDADIAGQTATLRGLDILKEAGFDVRVLQIPEGKDPDEFVRNNREDSFLKLVEDAQSLIGYRLKRAKEGINFNDQQSVVKYGNRVASIISDLNPVEKDIYIKGISEETGIKEQSLYDLIQMKKNMQNEGNMYKNGENGTKLYVEPAYLKAERSIIKLMLNKEFYDQIILQITEDDFNKEENKKIFNLIKNGMNEAIDNMETYIETHCDDPNSSGEWVNIKEFKILEANDKNKLIIDNVHQVKLFKVEEEMKNLLLEMKTLEKEGKLDETIKLAPRRIELMGKMKELKMR
ncbi:DNA primase [uncultured Clostridium sp.]|uniref:DNA primase n=1 Tax=uncultured Clostridium sp. TaxID=59620 RepID=UPI0026360D56|nr:DNA primase [uncultured Clostridium sp.]